MGKLQADEFASLVSEGVIDLRQAITWHLTSNHYPPVPVSWVEPCIEAVEYVNAYEGDTEVALPEGIIYMGNETAPAWVIVQAYHLYSWIHLDFE